MPLNLAFKALSDGTRREILHMLQQGDLTAGEIADRFAITKPSISHHLNALKQANLVQDVRKGQNIYYSLNTTVFQEVMMWFLEIVGQHHEGEKEKSGPRESHRGARPPHQGDDHDE